MIYRKITSNEYNLERKMAAECFNMPELVSKGTQNRGNVDNDIIFGAFCEERSEILSALTVYDLTINLVGGKHKAAGVGYVCTYPQYRKQGHCAKLMKLHLKDCKQKNCNFSFLYPFSLDFYRKFGYEEVYAGQDITIAATSLQAFTQNSNACLVSTDLMPEVRDFFNKQASMYNMMFYSSKFAPTLDKSCQMYAFYHRSVISGILSLKHGKTSLEVSQFMFSNSIVLKQMLNFVYSNRGSLITIIFKNMPQTSPILKVISERNTVVGTVHKGIMMRIVNVYNFFKSIKTSVCGHYKIKVVDSVIRENNYTFCVNHHDEIVDVSKTCESNCDVSLDIATLSRIAAGVEHSWECLGYFADVKIYNKNETIMQVFRQFNSMCVTHF